MRHLFIIRVAAILVFSTSLVLAESQKEPVDYVRPDIGGVSILLTTTRPIVALPHGYPQVTPDLNPGITDSYVATKIYGFLAGGVSLMPDTGSVKTDPGRIASSFDRDFETRTPYYYKGLLGDYNIWASYTIGHFAIFYRFRFPSAANRHINIMMDGEGWMKIVSPTIVTGSTTIHGVPYYFCLEFSKPFVGQSSWQYDGAPGNEKQLEGKKIGFTLNFTGPKAKLIQVKAGLSFISLDQAEKNLTRAIHGWNFDLHEDGTQLQKRLRQIHRLHGSEICRQQMG